MSEAGRTGAAMKERKMPPVNLIGTVALGFAIAGVTYLTSTLPEEPPFTPAIVLLALATAAVIANAITLARIQDFAWRIFFVVGGWTLLGYGLISGLLMFILIYNHLPAQQLAFQIATLCLLAVDVPMMLAFSVARYQR